MDRDNILKMKAEGNSLREIAKRLGVGYGTVRARLQLSYPPAHEALLAVERKGLTESLRTGGNY